MSGGSGRTLGREVVVLRSDGAYEMHLTYVQPATGAPRTGYVFNGLWYWRRDGDVETAYRSSEDRDTQRNAVATWARPDLRWVGLRFPWLLEEDDTVAY